MKSTANSLLCITVCLFLQSTISHAGAGDGSGGGGFAFYRSSAVLLKDAIEYTSFELNRIDGDCANSVLSKVELKPVTFSKMKEIIANTRKSYTKVAEKINPAGEKESLLMDFGTDDKGPYIEALGLFFVGYLFYSPKMSQAQEYITSVGALLLHEASHLFGYSEQDAVKFAELLTSQDYDKPVVLELAKCRH